METIQVTKLPDGGVVVEMDGETTQYSKNNVVEMMKDGHGAMGRVTRQPVDIGPMLERLCARMPMEVLEHFTMLLSDSDSPVIVRIRQMAEKQLQARRKKNE